VTDGKVNATIGRDSDPAAVTLEEAVVLLADAAKRKKNGKKKTARKKTVKKKTTKKKSAKKKASPKKKTVKKTSTHASSDDGS
jgi:DNA topoisomerase-1